MKKTLLLVVFIITGIAVHAQQTPPPKPKDPDSETMINEPASASLDTSKIFTAVEHEPEFPGITKFSIYLLKDINYSSKDEKEGYQASFLFNFIIERDGSISNVKELRRIPNSDIGKQLIRKIKESPKWKPAIQNGIPVRYRYNLPLHF